MRNFLNEYILNFRLTVRRRMQQTEDYKKIRKCVNKSTLIRVFNITLRFAFVHITRKCVDMYICKKNNFTVYVSLTIML